MVPSQYQDTAQSIFSDRLGFVEEYAQILGNEGIEWGLLGPRETERLWDRHILNSVILSPLIDQDSSVADLGSGAGLPGIPLAILRPDLRIELVEPMERRVKFLSMCVKRLGLGEQVRVVRSKAEQYCEDLDCEVMTCRALAPMTSLLDWVGSKLGSRVLLAIKGGRAPLEIEEATSQLTGLNLRAEILRPRIYEQEWGSVVRVLAAQSG